MSDLCYGICASCGNQLIAPGLKFPVSRPVKKSGKPGFYDVTYNIICAVCAEDWLKTYRAKIHLGDFVPHAPWEAPTDTEGD